MSPGPSAMVRARCDPMYTASDVTLHVPCYDASSTLESCLASIKRLTVRPTRVVIIDDGSPERVGECGFEVVRHEANRGLAEARNTALSRCETALLAGVDADVAVEPGWLEAMLEALNSNQVAGVGGAMCEHHQDGLADQWRAVHMAQHWGQAEVLNPRFLFGCNTLFIADELRAAGGWDGRMRQANEDCLLCEALMRAGRRLLYTPRATCRHLRRDTIRSVLHNFWKWHAPAGVLRGEFDSIARLLARIDAVGFGIFRHRFDLDQVAGRNELLSVDVILPWVFASLDVQLYSERHGEQFSFPASEMLELAGPEAAAWIRSIVPDSDWRAPCAAFDREFQRCLDAHDWHGRAARPIRALAAAASASHSHRAAVA